MLMDGISGLSDLLSAKCSVDHHVPVSGVSGDSATTNQSSAYNPNLRITLAEEEVSSGTVRWYSLQDIKFAEFSRVG
jgi:hypothetical protein